VHRKNTVVTGEPVTEDGVSPAATARLPIVVLGVIAVAGVATWWGWPPSLIDLVRDDSTVQEAADPSDP